MIDYAFYEKERIKCIFMSDRHPHHGIGCVKWKKQNLMISFECCFAFRQHGFTCEKSAGCSGNTSPNMIIMADYVMRYYLIPLGIIFQMIVGRSESYLRIIIK